MDNGLQMTGGLATVGDDDLLLRVEQVCHLREARARRQACIERHRLIDFTAYLERQAALSRAGSPRGAQRARYAVLVDDGRQGTAPDPRARSWLHGQDLAAAGACAEAQTAVVPLLVPLRNRSKAGSLNMLLAGHLAGAGMSVIDIPALTYLREIGRVVLLFDDFDKLALQVGSDAAAHHLATVMGSRCRRPAAGVAGVHGQMLPHARHLVALSAPSGRRCGLSGVRPTLSGQAVALSAPSGRRCRDVFGNKASGQGIAL